MVYESGYGEGEGGEDVRRVLIFDHEPIGGSESCHQQGDASMSSFLGDHAFALLADASMSSFLAP